MPFKNIEDKQNYQKNWMRNKRAGNPTRLTPLLTEEERLKRKKLNSKKQGKKLRTKKKLLIRSILGNTCFFCGRPRRLNGHRKDGTNHIRFYDLPFSELEAELKSQKYVLLCYECHKGVHWCMKILKMTWEDIIANIRKIYIH
jgi:hypothetical protein